ncbi:MAG: type II toxin-antitoxin system HicB family antitoxin [Synergistaceae bacterium]|nr:type II toxin-antitoxin system HicB family antitoxin [Synergistaceae bacterium]
MTYEYPAIISYSKDDKVYYVDFPDMSNCFTDGESLREALDNAEDALNLMLSYAEEQGQELPKSSDLNSIKLGSGEIVALVKTETASCSKIAV